MKRILFAASAFILLASTTCNKPVNNTTPQKTRTVLLTQASWKVTKLEARTYTGTEPGSTAYSDVTSQLKACQIDNVSIFNSNTTYEVNEGASKCNTTDPQVVSSGTWSFQSSQTQLQVITSTTNQVFDIVTISDTQLVVTTIIPGTTYNTQTRTTFSH